MSVAPSTTLPPHAADESDLREDGVFEMANLTQDQTGIEGVVYVSTREGQHGPRVKYFIQPGRSQPSYSVSISATPRLLVGSLPERVVNRTLGPLTGWVARNHEALLAFWNEGDSWTDAQVTRFKTELIPV